MLLISFFFLAKMFYIIFKCAITSNQKERKNDLSKCLYLYDTFVSNTKIEMKHEAKHPCKAVQTVHLKKLKKKLI